MKTLFVLVLAVFGFAACTRTPPVEVPEGARPHVAEDWFSWRAQTLGITPEQARVRDQSLPQGEEGEVPPPGTLDSHTQLEAALLWKSECARCHGMQGKPPPVAEGQTQPRAWGGMGPAMGFTFGGDKMRAGIYRKIAHGAGAMPGWKGYLAREQIWALVVHIERF